MVKKIKLLRIELRKSEANSDPKRKRNIAH
jgi:hypothetical protein